MTRVDFYILSGTHNRLGFVSKMTEQIYRQKHQLHIHTMDLSMSNQIDNLLWTYRDISFIPHERLQGDAPIAPVTISHEQEPMKRLETNHEILINLAIDVPDFFSRFERVVEIIDTDDSQRQQGRVRYRYYHDRGYELTNHNID